MASVINTNVMSLNAQRNLAKSGQSLATSMQRLSSGLRINSAKDDAAGLAITDRMTSQIRGLNQAVRNANDGISLAQTAEGSLQETTNILQRMRELSIQSANDSNSDGDRANIQKEVAQLQSEINRIAEQTSFNGKNILDGSFTTAKFHVGAFADQSISVSIGSAKATDMGNYAATSDVNMGTASATAVGAITNGVAADAGIQISGALGSQTVAASAGETASSYAAKVNAVSSSTGVTATAETTVQLEYGAGVANGDTLSFDLSSRDENEAIIGSEASISVVVSDTTSYTTLRDAINSVSASTGITAELHATSGITLTDSSGDDIGITNASEGGAAVALDITTADETINLTTAGTDSTLVSGKVEFSSSRAFTISGATAGQVMDATAASGTLSSVAAISVATQSGANSALSVIDQALSFISDTRADLGAIQNRMEATISNLSNISENVSAARSRVQDADFALETANLTRSQILQQAGTAMLAQANSSPNSVLSLLQ
ncbi:MAG: flagellin [Gammaproteobacteria bacterium]|nr:flagellin [Gammaproteobacteria bacterium]